MSRRVIALTGWRRSGKNTAADYLTAEYGFKQASFAAGLKDMVAETYNLDRASLDDVAGKEAPLPQFPVIAGDKFGEQIHQMLAAELRHGYWTPRAILILEGSIKRSVYSNYWVRNVASRIIESSEDYVITDLRYRTEADTLRMLIPDVQIVRVERFDSIETQDPSERDMDSYSYDTVIQNRGSLEQLHDAVDVMLVQNKWRY